MSNSTTLLPEHSQKASPPDSPTATEQTGSQLFTYSRRYDIDAIRVLAFGLLILYHVGMFYVAEWGWHIKSAYQSEPLQLVMTLLNQWRMPLIFLVSGMATYFLFCKTYLQNGSPSEGLAKNRFKRLGWPLLIGMLIVVPPQAYLEAVSNHATQLGYLEFLLHYFQFVPWPDGAFAGSEVGITWNHLWYLPYVLFYTLLMIPIAKRLVTPNNAFLNWLNNMNIWQWMLLPTLPLLFYGLVIFPLFPYKSHALVDDWYAHSMYFTFFSYGFLLANAQRAWPMLARYRVGLLALAVCSFAVFYPWSHALSDDASTLESFSFSCVLFLNRWLWILVVLAWGHHLLNRPLGWVQYANKAVFCWYIFHQTITVVAGYHLAKFALGPVAEPILVIAITVVGCGLAYELLKRIPWVGRFFGIG